MIVDDNEDELFLIQNHLKKLNAEIIPFLEPEESLEHVSDDNLALIILDVDMPGMDGYTLAEKIRSRPSSRYVPLIFYTGAFRDESHLFQGYEHGAVDYILKDSNPAILVEKVKILLELFLTRREIRDSEVRYLIFREVNRLENLQTSRQDLPFTDQDSLKKQQPETYDDLKHRYFELMYSMATKQKGRVDSTIPQRLNEIATTLSNLDGRGSDAISLHLDAIKMTLSDVKPELKSSLHEAGRIILLGIMDHLITFYRSRYLMKKDFPSGGSGQ